MYLLGSNIYVLIKGEFVIPFKDQNVLFGRDEWIMILDIYLYFNFPFDMPVTNIMIMIRS